MSVILEVSIPAVSWSNISEAAIAIGGDVVNGDGSLDSERRDASAE